jgi:hypothetical protein
MQGVRKQFNKKLHRDNDPKSRHVVKKFFEERGVRLIDNQDEYGIDLVSIDGSAKIEIEHRLVWTGKEFPFDEINLPERKTKFFLKNQGAYYVILSKDYSRMGMISGKNMLNYLNNKNLKESSNRFVTGGELFYKIPKSEFGWLDIKSS